MIVLGARGGRKLPGKPVTPTGRPSVLGHELTVYGQLNSSGEIHVHGIVAGDVTAPKVTLWSDGYIQGSILAQEAHIHGHLNGRTIARTVVVGASATIEGQIFHHTIDMAQGSAKADHVNARFPWRPVNYFEQFDEQLQLCP